MNETDPIAESLERVIEHVEDPGALMLARYAAARPESAALMSHMDEHMKGRMMADVLTLLLTDPGEVDRGYLHFEVTSHRNYGVDASLFPQFFECVRDWVRDALGAAWTDAIERAWQARIDGHLAAIREVAAD